MKGEQKVRRLIPEIQRMTGVNGRKRIAENGS